MKLDLTTRGLAVLCLVCTPFLGGADGGCGGGQVAIGGDPAEGGSAGSAGTSPNAGSTSTPGTGGSGTGGGSNPGAGGAARVCDAEQQALREFIADNKACSSDAACQTLYAGCDVTEDGCTGAVYVNGSTDLAVFGAMREAYSTCVDPAGCAVCERLSLPPACIAGKCMPGGGTPALCSLPVDAGPCDAAIPVFTAVNGVCVPETYGGCEGNENRFNTMEECMATCEGRPDPGPCPPNRVTREICLECGPAGGCAATAVVCALLCQSDPDCEDEALTCQDGVCQVGYCI
jgi:hypothetical protein